MCYFEYLNENQSENNKLNDKVQGQGSYCKIENFMSELNHSSKFLNPFFFKLSQIQHQIHHNSLILSNIFEKFQEIQDPATCLKEEQQSPKTGQLRLKSKPAKLESQIIKDLHPNYERKLFKYKLTFVKVFSRILYKNKKYYFPVKLVNNVLKSYHPVSNKTPINICFGIYDDEGNWLSESLMAESMVYGNTENILRGGRGEFQYINFKKSSHGVKGKKINIVIYAKPSCNKENKNQILWSEIKPLFLKNVAILSKRQIRSQSEEE